jgi:hypothetical protein
MEIRMVIFLFFVFVTVASNTLLMVFVYKAFAGLTAKVTETVSQFEKNGEIRSWVTSMETAAAEAVAVTEAARQKMAELEPMLTKAQENYSRSLVQADSKLQAAAEELSKGAQKMRDVVAKPAFSAVAFVAGLARVMEGTEEEGK